MNLFLFSSSLKMPQLLSIHPPDLLFLFHVLPNENPLPEEWTKNGMESKWTYT
jgi:hypothetical protein